MRSDTKAQDFSKAVKKQIADRDSFDGWPCCVNCGRPVPLENPLGFSNAHFIPRSQGGLGVLENGLTLCPDCHRRFDQSTERSTMADHFREYLKEKHPGWNREKLVYKKWEEI